MSFAKVQSAQTFLLSPQIIDIEVDTSKGLHSFVIVGLPDKAVEEARDRISSAIKNSGFKSPKSRNEKVIISLAPASLKKEGTIFDLGMAVAYLLATGDIKFNPDGLLFLGELALDGSLRDVSGVLPLVRKAKLLGFSAVFVPEKNAREAAIISDIPIFAVGSLKELLDHLDEKRDGSKLQQIPQTIIESKQTESQIDFYDISGQENAKRGLEIAASGGHNVALYGPPGTGKSMLAKAFSGILPPLSFDDILDVTSIHSIAGTLEEVISDPPFRSPHHTASYVSLVGGGATPRPGEITLAHKGVLFLDEFPEFESRVIESLRQPLEDHVISVSRAKGTALFPAHFILIAAMNPCPCGNFGFRGKECTCSPMNLAKYQRKLSGPLVERIDIWLEVPRIDHDKLSRPDIGRETSKIIRNRVTEAREIQRKRLSKISTAQTNGEMNVRDLVKIINLESEARDILNVSAQKMGFSPRVYHKIIKVAQTIADIEKSDAILPKHILEAIQYRPKENQYHSL